jgi:hypothetical protein
MATQRRCLSSGQPANNDGARMRRAATAQILTMQYARTDIRKYSFTVRVVEPWNQLPDSVKQAADKEAFKKAMKNLKN